MHRYNLLVDYIAQKFQGKHNYLHDRYILHGKKPMKLLIVVTKRAYTYYIFLEGRKEDDLRKLGEIKRV